MSDSAYMVKVRFGNERRFLFLGSGGRAVRLRTHALMVTDRDKAIEAADDQHKHGDAYGVVAARVVQDGRTVYHVGADTPGKAPDPYGPDAGYAYLVGVTKAGRPEFHITDDFGAWGEFDEAAYEACAAEAARAGVEPGKGYNVHAALDLFHTDGVRFVQRTNAA